MELANNRFPILEVPNRSTNNIIFDNKLKQYVLGEKVYRRNAGNIQQVKSFLQTIWVAYFAKKLLEIDKSTTLRDVYYSSEAYGVKFKNQEESDQIISDLEAILSTPREEFKIFPEERSAVFGDLTIEYTVPGFEGKTLNLTSSPDGVMVGPALTSSKFLECNADKVIAVESGGMFTRLIEEKAYKKFNAILIHTAGQAPRSTRRMIKRLNDELGLPVYIFTDGDPWGCHIAMVIISGSANSAHVKGLATPKAVWMGVWATDIEKYNLPTEEFNSQDKKRLADLMSDPRYQDPFWQKQLNKFAKLQRKAEQQAFSRYGLSFVVDKYLPEKFNEIEEIFDK